MGSDTYGPTGPTGPLPMPHVGQRVLYAYGYGGNKIVHLLAEIVHVHSDGSINLHVLNDGVHCDWDQPSRLIRRVVQLKNPSDVGVWLYSFSVRST